VLIGLGSSGCTRPRTTPPPVDTAKLDDAGFQAYLADAPVVTVDEACRAILILADGKDATTNWDERQAELLKRGWIRREWNLSPDHIANRGTVAYMLCEVCRVHGGVNRLLLGSWGPGDRRYAYRELVSREMMPTGTEWGYLTGGQMVSLLGKADALMEKKGLYQSEPINLGEQPKLDKQ